MATELDERQRRAALAEAGIGARYFQHRVSEVIPWALKLSDNDKEWINAGQHVLIISPTDEAACVFAGRLVNRRWSVFAVDAAMLIHYLEVEDQKNLAPIYSCGILVVLGFYSSSYGKCPFSSFQIRLLEGFLSTCMNHYDKNLILRATDDKLSWYSSDFTRLLLPNTQIAEK